MAGRYWQSRSLSLWAGLFDVFQSGSIPLKMKRGCASTPLTELPLLHIMSKGETGGFRVSISRAAMSLKQLSPGSSWCLQLLNLLLATILNVNVWLESVPSGFYFIFLLYSSSASKQNQNMFCQAESKWVRANSRQKLRCASMLLKSCLIICGGNALWHYMTKALVYLRARSQCTIHETEVNNDGSSKQLPYNIKTKSWTSESMAAQQVTQVSGRSRRCWVMSWCFGYTILISQQLLSPSAL